MQDTEINFLRNQNKYYTAVEWTKNKQNNENVINNMPKMIVTCRVPRVVTRLQGARGKKQVWRPCGRTVAPMVEVWRLHV